MKKYLIELYKNSYGYVLTFAVLANIISACMYIYQSTFINVIVVENGETYVMEFKKSEFNNLGK